MKKKKQTKQKIPPIKAFKDNAKIYKILASEKRLNILNHIKYKELSAAELGEITKTPKSNLSQHLKLLLLNGLITSYKEGRRVYYKIVDSRIVDACLILNVLREKKILKK